MACTYDDGGASQRKRDKDLDEATDRLCWLMAKLKDTSWVRPDIKLWWERHQKDDAARMHEERRRNEAELKRAEDDLKSATERLARLKK